MARILAIHAHPDDVEIVAGGTLALMAERGHELTIATMRPGNCGSKELGAEVVRLRTGEVPASAREAPPCA